MQTTISNPTLTIREVGKMIKSSKIVFTWRFCINNNQFEIKLYHSKVSRKRRVMLGDRLVHESREIFNNKFKFSFEDNGITFCISQTSQISYDLNINEGSFVEGVVSMPTVKQEEEKEEEPDYADEEYKELENYYIPRVVNKNPVDMSPINMNPVDMEIEKMEDDMFNPYCSIFERESKVERIEQMEEVKMDIFSQFDLIAKPSNFNLLDFEPKVPKRPLNDLLGEIDFTEKETRIAPYGQDVTKF
jgi:hypothetical protein